MTHIFVRPLRMYDEADKAAFVAAADACGKEFPKDVFTLLPTRIMVAEQAGKIIMYQPQFASLQLGSLIPTKGISGSTMASAQHQLFAAAFTRSHTEGFADIVAFSSSEETRQFSERHGLLPVKDALRYEIR
jgi:hypothetical protein